MIFWLIGLSGSGKTTLGSELARKLRETHPNTVLLDGDELRGVFKHDRGSEPYTVEGRRQNAERMTALCEMLDRQCHHVVCCILSIFPEMRAENRQRFSSYFEIFMDASMDVLQNRDVKGIYGQAARGEIDHVVGVDIPFERPENPDMIIDSSGEEPDLERQAAMILKRAGLST